MTDGVKIPGRIKTYQDFAESQADVGVPSHVDIEITSHLLSSDSPRYRPSRFRNFRLRVKRLAYQVGRIMEIIYPGRFPRSGGGGQ